MTKSTPQKNRNLRKRLAIVQRERCFYCDAHVSLAIAPAGLTRVDLMAMSPRPATVDHVIPRCAGGKKLKNTVLACLLCNQSKNNAIPDAETVARAAKIYLKAHRIHQNRIAA